MKNKIISLAAAISMMFSFMLIFPFEEIDVSASGIDNITARADYLYGTTWTAKTNVKGWRDKNTFIAGSTYHIPYGQPVTNGKYICWGVSVDDFLNSTQNASSVFYTKRSYYSGNAGSNSTYYAMDCSALLSYCWDLPGRVTTYTISTGKDSDGNTILSRILIGDCNSSNVNKIEVGDALNRYGSSNDHVALVSRVERDASGNVTKIEVTEQTPPETKRSYYTPSQLVSSWGTYKIYRYNKRDSVTPPPITSEPKVYTNHKYYVPNSEIDIMWNDVGAESYWIDIYRDGEHIISRNLGNVTKYTDICYGQHYEVYITALNGDTSAISECCEFFLKPMTSPKVYTNHKYYAPNSEIDIMWDEVEGATGYWIDIWRDGEHIITRDLGNVTKYTDIFYGQHYEVYVSAYNNNGGWDSAISDRCEFFLKPMTAPKVQIESKYNIPNAQLTLTWNKIEGATGYWIDIYRDNEHIISDNLGNVTEYTDQFFGKDYKVYITAFNDIGGWDSAVSEACEFHMFIPGDCNSSCELTIDDVEMLQKWLLAAPEAELTDWRAADLNDDGVIDTIDLSMMKRMLINK